MWLSPAAQKYIFIWAWRLRCRVRDCQAATGCQQTWKSNSTLAGGFGRQFARDLGSVNIFSNLLKQFSATEENSSFQTY